GKSAQANSNGASSSPANSIDRQESASLRPTIESVRRATDLKVEASNGKLPIIFSPPGNGNGDAADLATGKFILRLELTEKIKELFRLAQEQGYLTQGDIQEALPGNLITPEE